MRYIQIIFFILISFAVNAQQTFNPTLTGKAEAVGFGIGDTIGQIINFSDQSNFGFTLNQLEKNAIILDQAGTFWKIDSIFYKNALSSQIGISKIQGSSLYLYGDIAIMNLNSNGLITPATTNVTGITPKQQAEILNYVFNNITSSGSSEVSWSDILGIPEGFADGIDNTAEAGSGDGYATSGSYNTVAKTIDIAMADPAVDFSIAVDSLLNVNQYDIETFTYASSGTPLSSGLIDIYFADNEELRINLRVIDNNASTVIINLPDAELYADKKLFIFGYNKTTTGKIEVNGIHDQPVDYELKDQQVIYLQSSEITLGTYQDYVWLLINSGTSSETVVETDPVWIADSTNYATKIYADQYDDSGLTLQNVTDNDNVTTNEVTVIDTVNGTKVIVQPSGIIQQYLTSAYGNEVFNFGDRWRGYNANYWRAAGTPSSPSHVLDQYVLGTRNWWGWNQAVNNYLTVFQEYVKTTGEYTTAYNTPGVYQLNSNNNNNWITGFQLSTTGQAYFPNLADGSSFDQFLKRNSTDGEIGFGTLSWNSLQDIPADIADGDANTQNTVNTDVNYIPYWDGDSWENSTLSYVNNFTNIRSNNLIGGTAVYGGTDYLNGSGFNVHGENHPSKAGEIWLYTTGFNEMAVFTPSGLGLNTNTPAARLDVNGTFISRGTNTLTSVAQDDTATKIAALNASNEVVYRDVSTLGGGGTDSVSWNLLTDVPEGFADGFDNVASEGTGDGVTTGGTYSDITETINFTGTEGVSYSVDVSALLDNTDTQLTQDQVQDFVGLLFGTDTESLISTSYDNTTNTLTFTVDNNLDNYDNSVSQFLKTEVDGSITNEANTGMSWDDVTNTLSVTDPNGSVSAIITGYLEEITGTELVFDGWDKDASDDLVDADFATTGLMATDGAGNYSIVSEYDPSSTNELNNSLSWDNATNTLTVNDGGGDKSVIITGFDDSYDYMVTTVKNPVSSGYTISVGDVVGFAGSPGNSTEGVFGNLFSGTQDQSYNVIGIASEEILEDAKGLVVTEGVLTGVNTVNFNTGDLLYVSTTTPGALTTDNSSHIMVAAVLQGGVSNGSILIRPDYYANENDPTFSASDAASIAAADIANWNAAYGWGDHSTAGYATTAYVDANDDNTQNTVNTANNTIPYWNTTTTSWESSNAVNTASGVGVTGELYADDITAYGDVVAIGGLVAAQPALDNSTAFQMLNAASTTNLTIRPNGDNSIIRQANANGTLDLETSNLSLSTLAENAGNTQVLTYDAAGDKLVGFANISSLGVNQTLQDVTDNGAITTNNIIVDDASTLYQTEIGPSIINLARETGSYTTRFYVDGDITKYDSRNGHYFYDNNVLKAAVTLNGFTSGGILMGSNNSYGNLYSANPTGSHISQTLGVGDTYPYDGYGHLVIAPRSNAPRDIVFATKVSGAAEIETKAVIKGETGRLGIGTTVPSYLLHVNGTVGFPAISDGSSFDQILARNSITGEVGYTTDQTGTDDQTIDVLSLDGTTLNISLENDGETTKTLDLSPLASGGGLTWDDQTKVSYVYSGEDLDLSTVFTGDFRNYHIVLNTENISSSRASLPTPSATYEKYLVMVTCIDPGTGGCFVDNVGVAGSTLSEFMYPGDAAFVKCVKIDNAGTYGWVMTESDAALVDVTLQSVTSNGNTTTYDIETSGSLTVGTNLNLSSVNVATDLSQVGDGILTIDDGVVTRVSTSVFANQDAIEVPFTSTSTLSSTNVQDAIEELDTELRNKVDNYIVAGNEVNVTINSGVMNQFTNIDLNSQSTVNFSVSGTPTSGGVYTFFFRDPSGAGTTVNFPIDFNNEDGTAISSISITASKWFTCIYDGTNYDGTTNSNGYYCK